MQQRDYKSSDDSQVPILLSQLNGSVVSFKGDTAYDTDSVYDAIKNKFVVPIAVVIPPRKDAALSTTFKTTPNKRDDNILYVEEHGKYKWQDHSQYNDRSIVETTMYRYKQIIGDALCSRELSNQKVEAKVGCKVLNIMAKLGMPQSSRVA